MTESNYLRGLLGLPPQQRSGLLGDTPMSALANALAQALNSPPPTPRQLSLGEALEALSRPAPSALGLGALAQALGSTEPPMSGLARFTGVPTPPPSMTNPFADYGIPQKTDPLPYNNFNPAPAAKPYLPPVNRTPSVSKLPAVRRKTFFSFQYADIMRVNQVRKSWLIRPTANDPRSPLWFQDSSIWEKSKETSDAKLRRLILDGLDRTSVTCVLAGEETWSRTWVRFEIAASVQRGNGLLTVYIHGLKCPNSGIAYPGHNPLDFIGLYEKPTGGYYLCEKGLDGQWYQYDKITTPVPWPKYLPKASARNIAQPLSAGTKAYDYGKNGYANLSLWVQGAAVAAGK